MFVDTKVSERTIDIDYVKMYKVFIEFQYHKFIMSNGERGALTTLRNIEMVMIYEYRWLGYRGTTSNFLFRWHSRRRQYF